MSERSGRPPPDLEINAGYRAGQIRRREVPRAQTETHGEVETEELSEWREEAVGRRWRFAAWLRAPFGP